jgi:hypothetical protein
MSDDLIARLRHKDRLVRWSTVYEAADEIERLRAAIDKVLALPLMNHKTECKHCGHFTDTFAADTEATRVALTQGGEG